MHNTGSHTITLWQTTGVTLLTKLYWVLFSIEDLRQAVETAKRI